MSLPLAAVYLLTSTASVGPADPAVEPEQVVSEAEPATAEEGKAKPETGPAQDRSIVVTGKLEAPPGDPLEQLNLQTFELTQSVDRAFVEPMADAYEKGLPKPIRLGLRNFFRNLLEPVNFLNYLLQFKPGKAFETAGRFALNSTVGVAGLIDVAEKKPFNLPYRRNGLANTLGYYGVGPGPFLVLPLVGATTLRDVLGGLVDQAVVPFVVGAPFDTPYYAVPAYTVNSLEFRIEFDEKLREINESVDPYSAMRETYLCQREADIAALKNRPPPRDCSLDALFAEDATRLAPAANSAEMSPGSEDTAENVDPLPAVETAVPLPETESAQPPMQSGLHHPSLSLENGCAFLEQGVNTLHVVACQVH